MGLLKEKSNSNLYFRVGRSTYSDSRPMGRDSELHLLNRAKEERINCALAEASGAFFARFARNCTEKRPAHPLGRLELRRSRRAGDRETIDCASFIAIQSNAAAMNLRSADVSAAPSLPLPPRTWRGFDGNLFSRTAQIDYSHNTVTQ